MEKDRALKILEGAIKVAVPVGLMIYGSVWSFSKPVRQQVIEEQNGRCAVCGKPARLQCHHRVAQCQGGTDRRDNAVGLCPEDHRRWDKKTLEEGIVYPGIPIHEAPDKLIKNRKLFAKMTKRF